MISFMPNTQGLTELYYLHELNMINTEEVGSIQTTKLLGYNISKIIAI